VKSERAHYIDVVRACASPLVVLSHVCIPLWFAIGQVGFPTWELFSLASLVTKTGVPLFLMISGKLLLGSSRAESAVTFLKRRLSKILLPFLSWSVIYAFVFAHVGAESEPAWWALKNMYWRETAFHLWFMYVILGVYLVTPPLRIFVRHASLRDIGYVLALWYASLVLGFVFDGWSSVGPASRLVGFGGYFLLGHFLDKIHVSRRTATGLGLVAVAAFAVSAVGGYHATIKGDAPDGNYYGHLAPLLALAAGCLFLGAKSLPFGEILAARPRLSRFMRWLSAESYNVYLMHLAFVIAFANGWFGFTLTAMTGGTPFIGVPLTLGTVLLSSWALSTLIQKIPFLSRCLVLPVAVNPA